MKPSLLNISKAMAFATAIGAASVAWAQQVTGVFPASTDFESDTDYVVLDSTASNVSPRPESHGTFTASPSKVLDLEEADEPIVKSFGTSLSGSVYIDTLFKGMPATTTPDPIGATDKLLVYSKIFTEPTTTTNLCVWAKDAANGTAQEFKLTDQIDKDTWYRVIIAANNGEYQVFLNNNYPSTPCATAGGTSTFYALNSGVVSQVAFAGSGRVDDLVLSDVAPDKKLMTLSWDTSLTASYTVAGGEPIALSGTSPQTNAVAPGAAVVLTVLNSDGASKVYTGTAGTDSEIGSASATFTWADYLGDAVDGAYQIDDAADLNMLRKGVAAGLSTTGETFKQTADINMASAGAFAGIGTYAKIPTNGVPFLGTYDGQGHTIANITRAGGDTQGIFNQVGVGGVIENLVVSNMVFASDVSGEYGFAIVGNAGGGATLRNLTAAGVFGSADKPSTHNMAGIVVRLSPGATAGDATTIDSCTNNATIYGGYTKLGGINAIVQDQTGFKNGKVVFVNCANNGTLVCKRTATDVTGNAGIVGYFSGTNVELTNCYGNGVITNENGANTDKDGALVGWTISGTIKDNGGNSAPSNKKMIGTWGSATETGFQYATVETGVATTLDPPYTLAEGETYLLEGNATPSFALAAAGDTIAFDTALGYTLTGTGITAAEGLAVTSDKPEGSTVTTFTVAVARYVITWTDHGGTVKTETLDYGATPTAPATAPVQYVENGKIYTGTWPTPASVTGTATYAAVYTEGDSAVATVITIADAGATTNVVGYYASLKAAVEAAPAGATVVLLADDAVSFAGVQVDADRIPSNGSIVIDKNLTIDGCCHTVTGVSNAEILNATGSATPGYDMAADLVNGSNLLGFFVKSGDVTFKNLTLTEFGDTAYVNKFGYTPIQTASAYADDLVLENVNIDKFNRTAVCVRGGTLSIIGGTITANAAHKTDDHFQQPIEVRGGTATIDGLTVDSDIAYENGGGAIVAWSATTLTNVVVDFTGIGVWSDGPAVAIVGEDTSIEATVNSVFAEEGGTITIADGDFAGSLAVDSDPGSGITVNGGTFDAPVPAEFVGANLAPTTIAEDGKYTVKTARTVAFTVDGATYTNIVVATGEAVSQPADPVSDAYAFTGWTLNGSAYDFSSPVTADINLEATITSLAAATWIGGVSGNWQTASNWDFGYVPTKATVVTFTNDAQVAILTDRCNELVLDNANVTLVRDGNATEQPILHIYGNNGRAVSVATGATGSLGVNNLHLFNQRQDGADLTIGCDLAILGDVTFRGVNPGNNVAASFAITGKTTVSANAKVRTIDWANTKFQGGIEVSPGVVAKISTQPNGKATIGNGITLVANDNAGAHAAVWLMQYRANSGGVEFTGGASVAVDANHAATCYVKTTSSGGRVDDVWCDVYELYRKRTVKTVTVAEGLAVTGVTTGQRVAPGEELTIGVSGVAEGYEPSVTITKNSDSSVLLTTNAVSFAYTMPDFDIDVSVTANEVVAQLPAWATDVTGDPTAIDPAVREKYADWAKDIAGSSADLTQDCSAQFLMNVPVAAEVALTIDGIEVTSDGTIVTIGATQTISGTTEAIALGTTDAGVDTSLINGILNVMVADTLGNWAKKSIPLNNLSYVGGKAQVLIPAGDGRFVKASVDYSKPSSSITAVTE